MDTCIKPVQTHGQLVQAQFRREDDMKRWWPPDVSQMQESIHGYWALQRCVQLSDGLRMDKDTQQDVMQGVAPKVNPALDCAAAGLGRGNVYEETSRARNALTSTSVPVGNPVY